jgi:hypothetical protein
VVTVGLLAAACGDDSSADDEAESSLEVGEPDAGDFAVAARDGWRIVPLTDLGFALTLPEDWEDVVLDEAGFDVLEQASPTVTDFVSLAQEAGAAGAVFYAAGTDPEDPEGVNDLKVLPRFEAVEEVTDADQLEAFAQERADSDDLDDVEVEPLEDWRFPAVDVRYRVPFDDMTAVGVERLVLAPSGMVFSLILTGEDDATVETLATEVLDSFDFT